MNQAFHRANVRHLSSFLALCAIALFCLSAVPACAGQQPQDKQPDKQQSATQPEKTSSQSAEIQKPAPTKAEIQQKQLADDTAKLLQLANELKADMDKSTKDTLSMSVVKKANEIEKLAHKVRDEMKASLGN